MTAVALLAGPQPVQAEGTPGWKDRIERRREEMPLPDPFLDPAWPALERHRAAHASRTKGDDLKRSGAQTDQSEDEPLEGEDLPLEEPDEQLWPAEHRTGNGPPAEDESGEW